MVKYLNVKVILIINNMKLNKFNLMKEQLIQQLVTLVLRPEYL